MTELRDLIIVLPGIMGSELRNKDGQVVWGISWRMIWNLLKRGGFEALTLRDVDAKRDEDVDDDGQFQDVLSDGLSATGLLPCAHVIPGFWKIDFYSDAIARIQRGFPNAFRAVATAEAIRGGPIKGRTTQAQTGTANLIEFPYDWRRDNRVAANLLKTLVDQQSNEQARRTGDRPRVILIAHSMGGLVARFYLERLGGWDSCRALITCGTPYRGAPQALTYLLNGYPGMPAYVADVLRSFTAVYQLLPLYPVVFPGGGAAYHRVHEASGLAGVDSGRARVARQFHETMLETASAILPTGSDLIPFVGLGQPTTQALRWNGVAYAPDQAVPPASGAGPRQAAAAADVYAGGDGTVPRISATPPEFSDAQIERFVVERHSALLTNDAILKGLVQWLRESQGPGLSPYLAAPGAAESEPESGRPSLWVEMADKHEHGQPVKIRVRVVAGDAASPPQVTIRPDGSPIPQSMSVTPISGTTWEAVLPPPTSNLYRVEVRATIAGSGDTLSVHDVLVVDD